MVGPVGLSHFVVIAFLVAILKIPNKYFVLKFSVPELLNQKKSSFQLNCIAVPNIAINGSDGF